jgi:hypothetical protein
MQACDIFPIISDPSQETNAMPPAAVSLSLTTNWSLVMSNEEEAIPSMTT